MSKQVRLRRGTTADHANFTGADGEVTYDTDKKLLVLHDGVTPGGHPMAPSLVLAPDDEDSVQTLVGLFKIDSGNTGNLELEVAGESRFQAVDIRRWLTLSAPFQRSVTVVPYASTVTLHFDQYSVQSINLTGNITFALDGLVGGLYGLNMIIRIAADSSTRTMAFPAGWRWVGSSAPASIAANKVALLELFAFGPYDSDVIARYWLQP